MSKRNIKLKKYRIPLMASALGLGGMLLFSYLTFVPVQTFATTEERTLMNIKYMQQLSPEICTNTAVNQSKQLVDNRVDASGQKKSYYVTKLADGNCWMTQNMDYDGGGTLKAISAWSSSYNSSDNKFYNDPGDYVYTYSGHGQKSSGYCHNVQSFDSGSSCTDLFTKVTSSNQSTLDMHYHVGNFYTYDAAINGVCPTGWQLPTSNTTDDGSFGGLMKAYSISGSTNLNKLYSDTYPLRFVYGGLLDSSNLSSAGYDGRYWSSTPNGSGNAYYLLFANSVYPSNNGGRYPGYSVRCLVKTTSKNLSTETNGDNSLHPDPAYPDDPDLNPKPSVQPDGDQANVAITVAPVISIDVTKHADEMETDFVHVAKDIITAKVGANQPYKVLISTEQEEMLPVPDEDDTTIAEEPNTFTIPMITKDGPIVPSISAWGISKDVTITRVSSVDGSNISIKQSNITNDTIYSRVGVGNDKIIFYESDSAATEFLDFPVAIGVSSSVPIGTYATKVTLTAMAE